MVDAFFKSFLEGSSITAPDIVLGAFASIFPEAFNIEWLRNGDLYEAIFYDKDVEKIAKFNTKGSWLETGINREVNLIPLTIKSEAEKFGEIMNSIEFKTTDSRKFEIIVRDSRMNRFLLIISDSGDLINNRPII